MHIVIPIENRTLEQRSTALKSAEKIKLKSNYKYPKESKRRGTMI